jgi:hypothetical protein
MDAITTAALELLKAVKANNVPLTLNVSSESGVVFVYRGENWELFSNAIRRAVDLQERLLERQKGQQF